MLHNILGTKTKEKILRQLIFNPSKSYYSRELAKKIGVTHASISEQIKPLIKTGLIKEEVKGRMKFYSIIVNRKTKLLKKLWNFDLAE
ncbi:MAG: winged helix-turn-helix domain-containing protein [Candidatus Aenigmarchaeota archaeon]|nr:winged helix-turn-helix domain-containing protein [Candidatus Aenigmarchaeota archaeon]